MEFRILGSRVRVRGARGEAIGVFRPQVRRLLAVLLAAEGRPVPADVLAGRLWDPADGTDPAAELEQVAATARRVLPDGLLVIGDGGLRLRLEKGDLLDLREFRDLAADARRRRGSDADSAAASCRRALRLWADQPLGDLPSTLAMEPVRRSLLGERSQVREELAEILLARGGHREFIVPGRSWAAQEPVNEHLIGLLMLALHRDGRAAEALRLYEKTAALLEPAGAGPGLRRTAELIGRRDPRLDLRPRPVLTPLAPDRAAGLRIDSGTASPARIYDYYLGGKDNYEVDRAAAEAIMKTVPEAPAAARANRAFLARAVRYLAAHAGIRQFVDVGAGLPTQGNVHEIVHGVAPDGHVVYVDNDPTVLVHGRALLEGSPNVAVIRGDLRRPEEIMADPRLAELIDLTEPVGLLLVAILHFIPDGDDPAGLVARLVERLPSGSHVVVSHGYEGGMDPGDVEHAIGVRRGTAAPICSRGPEQVAGLLTGLDVLPPGIVWIPEWGLPHPPAPAADPQLSHFIGGIARKP
ncbi:SAM-dependent methyltransferase [Actinomadura sp. NAK00032]|uniref:SAM-dependent methyltransferase n=1 Tax=Actinomadura sp. NAK00032 TaxID=2742128 RepID=UPI0020C75CB6|nr:SAM-dependent methyltransferase [Actinomadura sp. NAK00032]